MNIETIKLKEIQKIYDDYIGNFISRGNALSLIGDVLNKKQNKIYDFTCVDRKTGEIVYSVKEAFVTYK